MPCNKIAAATLLVLPARRRRGPSSSASHRLPTFSCTAHPPPRQVARAGMSEALLGLVAQLEGLMTQLEGADGSNPFLAAKAIETQLLWFLVAQLERGDAVSAAKVGAPRRSRLPARLLPAASHSTTAFVCTRCMSLHCDARCRSHGRSPCGC